MEIDEKWGQFPKRFLPSINMINGFEIRRCSGEMRVYESDGEMNGNTCVYLFSFALRGWNILSTRAR